MNNYILATLLRIETLLGVKLALDLGMNKDINQMTKLINKSFELNKQTNEILVKLSK